MRVSARLDNLRVAPRKVRLVAHSIVGLPVAEARVILRRQVKRASSPMETLLMSAVANATNNFSLEEKTLVVKEVRVGDGLRLKRYMPKAFGQATPILRRSSKVHIILEGEKATAAPTRKKRAATEKKKENKSEELSEIPAETSSAKTA